MNTRRLLIVYALLNAVLYSLLLPLWEGFDEPFHFAYVQQMANGQGWPDPRTARLSKEVGASLLLAPASQLIQLNLPQVTSYEQYFSWPSEKRADARRQLNLIPADLRWQPSQFANYEAHHPPLAYILLALPERLLHLSLPMRVAVLRILVAAAGSLLLFAGSERLFLQLGIRDPYNTAALFCLLSCQMTWAALAHVGNDWLAVPIAVWMLVAVNRFDANPGFRTVTVAAIILALGLLTKAYSLAFVPLILGLCAIRRRWRELAMMAVILCGLAGPWYARNLARYGVLTGTQESRAGVGVGAVLNAAPTLNWAAVIPSSIRSALWTGNNSFSAFSAHTLNLLIGALLIALLLWADSRHGSAEWITLCYGVLFVLALGYAAITAYVYTRVPGAEPSPWYFQVLSAPVFGLAMLGASRWQRLGRMLTIVLVVLFGYLLAATYVVKFIPLYGGYEGRTTLRAVILLYSHGSRKLAANLDTVALAPAGLIFVLTGAVIVLSVALQMTLLLRVFTEDNCIERARSGCLRDSA